MPLRKGGGLGDALVCSAQNHAVIRLLALDAVHFEHLTVASGLAVKAIAGRAGTEVLLRGGPAVHDEAADLKGRHCSLHGADGAALLDPVRIAGVRGTIAVPVMPAPCCVPCFPELCRNQPVLHGLIRRTIPYGTMMWWHSDLHKLPIIGYAAG